MMNQEVRAIMTTDPLTVHSNETLSEVSSKMISNQVQQVPVVDDGKLMATGGRVNSKQS